MGFKSYAATVGAACAANFSVRVRILTLALAMAGSGALAANYPDSPRMLTAAGLMALSLCSALWRVSARMASAPALLPDPEPLPRDPHLAEQMEARLEHAPVALFRLCGERAEPLNARARRLLAPGYVSDAAALFRQLAQTTARQLIRFDTERGSERALASSSSLIVAGGQERLLALLPLESELEAETLRAWQQLVHVLTHEIMNSLTPVASLSRTASGLVAEEAERLPPQLRQDLDLAFAAISRRADSLADFVASYRSLSSVPAAEPARVELAGLFARLQALAGPDWRARGGDISFRVEPATLELMADEGQLEQALLNLMRNAFEATAGLAQAKLEVSAALARGGRLRLEVRDNGPGVAEDCIERIFTPFYTTKSQGRGIGLALVRQLVNNNGGTVRYARALDGGARFVLTF